MAWLRTVGGFWTPLLIPLLVNSVAYPQKYKSNPGKIGHRHVAHKSIISPEKELDIGKQMAVQFERSIQIVSDPSVEQYMTTVALSVAAHSDWKHPVTVRVIRAAQAQSFSLPGGFI